MQLFDDRILIDPVAAPERSRGGLFLPATARQPMGEPKVGIVRECGPGRSVEDDYDACLGEDYRPGEPLPPLRIAMRVKPGDKVLYNGYAETAWEHEGVKLVFITERDVIGKLD